MIGGNGLKTTLLLHTSARLPVSRSGPIVKFLLVEPSQPMKSQLDTDEDKAEGIRDFKLPRNR